MKVKIQKRVVYHKIAEVEIEIPNLIDEESEVHQYLIDHEYLYVDKIQTQLDNAELEFGFGLGDGMEDENEESEERYEIVGKNYGGHL